MLTVGIELNGTVVVMVVSVLEARLERAGEAQIDGQIEKAEPMFTSNGSRLIFRAVVHHDVIVLGIV